jgi:hypothetical protein
MRLIINSGEKFGMLTVINEVDSIRLPSGQTNRVFLCRCDCGNEKKVRLVHLNHTRIVSCGCSKMIVKLGRKYNQNEKYIMRIYKAIKDRVSCNAIDSHVYYERGITVCDEWLNNPSLFLHWGLKNNLVRGMHIDRIDNEKGYSPQNCRVVTPKQNANNKRNTFFIIYNGEKISITELLEKKGLIEHVAAIRTRIKRGWNHEDAINTPIRKGKYRKKIKDETNS